LFQPLLALRCLAPYASRIGDQATVQIWRRCLRQWPQPMQRPQPLELAMSLIPCPECGREISTNAEACPHCGNPMRAASHTAAGPKCYACSATATTRCQRCGEMSCVQHVQSIFVPHGNSGSYELRCPRCYESAQFWRAFRWVIVGIFLFILLMVVMSAHH
jgi:hypothetical protein